MPDILNLQRKIKLDLDPFKSFSTSLISEVPEAHAGNFSIAFISDKRMRQLNEVFRGKDATTDVLSFPYEADPFDPDQKNLGDIVISIEQAQKQAGENDLSLELELKQLILHGLLHLCGMDHETENGEMNTRELDLRKRLGI